MHVPNNLLSPDFKFNSEQNSSAFNFGNSGVFGGWSRTRGVFLFLPVPLFSLLASLSYLLRKAWKHIRRRVRSLDATQIRPPLVWCENRSLPFPHIDSDQIGLPRYWCWCKSCWVLCALSKVFYCWWWLLFHCIFSILLKVFSVYGRLILSED